MKTLFIDCTMGAAGDMLSAALLELTENAEETLKELNAMGLSDTQYAAETVKKCGIAGTKLHVIVNGTEENVNTSHEAGHHHHHTLSDIISIINGTSAPEEVKAKAISVYGLLANAESAVHHTEVSNIHFHEVGTMDAVADILAFCYLINKLNVEYVVASPVNVGSGTVKCAHGILPVPAPATANLLNDVPIYSGEIESELCTPTGAALLKYFVNSFSDLPLIKIEKSGYGMGTKDFERANCARVMLGESESPAESIVELCFNVDDMTAEEIAFGTEELLRSGVTDVFTTAVYMKKNRPGTMVTVLCSEDDEKKTVELIFKHFSTIGVRKTQNTRYVMQRSISEVKTEFGTVRRKDAQGFGQKKQKYEYEDLARLARENNCSITEIKARIENEE